ncbi:MAG TPA: PilZ domain-containing protein [Gammaproteobacteria bacterium]|nr:PilZ domain-containing protein [Gammaproteobacteria bacterium]
MTMRLDYKEKRNFTRMDVECVVDYKVPGATEMQQAAGHDLSAGGVRFETEQEIAVGTLLEIVISPQQQLTPPLEATAEVVRVDSSTDGKCFVSCQFHQLKS